MSKIRSKIKIKGETMYLVSFSLLHTLDYTIIIMHYVLKVLK